MLDDSGAVSAVYKVLQGRRGHVGVPGGGACADWVASYSRVPDAPDRIQQTLRALGRRILRNLLDLGWVDEAELRRLAGIDAEAEVVSRRSGEEAPRLFASVGGYAPAPYTVPVPPRMKVEHLPGRTADLSRFGHGKMP